MAQALSVSPFASQPLPHDHATAWCNGRMLHRGSWLLEIIHSRIPMVRACYAAAPCAEHHVKDRRTGT